MKANDFGRTFEGAEQDDDAAVLANVRGGFGTAAGVVLVNNFHGAKHAEGIAAFGRDVEVSFGGKRRGGDEEDFLLRDPIREIDVDFYELFAQLKLLGVFDAAGFADDGDADLAGVLEFVFDFADDAAGEGEGLFVVQDRRRNEDAEFATGLHGKGFFDAFEGHTNFFERFEAPDVSGHRFRTCARA